MLPLTVFVAEMCVVTLSTLRIIFVSRGQRAGTAHGTHQGERSEVVLLRGRDPVALRGHLPGRPPGPPAPPRPPAPLPQHFLTKNPSPRPPPRSGEGEQNISCPLPEAERG